MPYSGQDFAATQPGEIRTLSIDFTPEIAVLLSTVLTIGGSVTSGDTVSVTVTATALPSGSAGVSYVAGSADTLSTIAAALAAQLTGLFELIEADISAAAVGAAITIEYPPALAPLFDATAVSATSGAQATETAEFATGALSGETLTTPIVATCTVFTVQGGSLDPSPSGVIGSATISGTLVEVALSGNQLAGNTYRITLQPTTSLSNKPILYSHILCAQPE